MRWKSCQLELPWQKNKENLGSCRAAASAEVLVEVVLFAEGRGDALVANVEVNEDVGVDIGVPSRLCCIIPATATLVAQAFPSSGTICGCCPIDAGGVMATPVATNSNNRRWPAARPMSKDLRRLIRPRRKRRGRGGGSWQRCCCLHRHGCTGSSIVPSIGTRGLGL